MIIAFAGCDGAGKSTQIADLGRWLGEAGLGVEVIDRWDILDGAKYPECRFLRSSRDEVRVANSEMEGPSRAMFLFWTMSVAAQRIDPRDPARVWLVDGYWMKHAAAELEYGCDPAWIDATVRCFPPADLTLYLDVTPEEALRRKPELTPYECGRDPGRDPAGFLAHQAKLRRRLLRWAGELGWKTVSSMQAPERVTEEIRTAVSESLPGRARPEGSSQARRERPGERT
jgi:dTMP kinase